MDKRSESLTSQNQSTFKVSDLPFSSNAVYGTGTGTNAYYSYSNDDGFVEINSNYLEEKVKQVLENCLNDDLNIVLNFLRKRMEEVIDNPESIFDNSDIQNKIMAFINDTKYQLEKKIDTLENDMQTLNSRLNYLETLINSNRSINTTTTALPNSTGIQF